MNDRLDATQPPSAGRCREHRERPRAHLQGLPPLHPELRLRPQSFATSAGTPPTPGPQPTG